MPLNHVPSPYGFAPLIDHVTTPEWAELASHDVPFQNGISGWIELVIKAVTPIFTRGTEEAQTSRDKPARFYQLPDGRYALPGSGVRGAVRNVVEIASFSRLDHMNDHTFGFRDLHNRDLYGKYMADILMSAASGKKEPMPLVEAGWLEVLDPDDVRTADGQVPETELPTDVVAKLHPAHFAKVEYEKLVALSRKRGVANFNPGAKQSATAKYAAWERANASLEVSVTASRIRDPGEFQPGGFLSEYGRVEDFNGNSKGALVFTGQPTLHDPTRPKRRGAGNAKHHDFVFFGTPKQNGAPVGPMDVTRRMLDAFKSVHAERGGQRGRVDGAELNEELAYLWRRARAEERDPAGGDGRPGYGKIPVFFLRWREGDRDIVPDAGAGKLRAMGLAMMFRMAYNHSVAELRPEAHKKVDEPDFATTLFGWSDRGRGGDRAGKDWTRGLRSRVSFDTFVCNGKARELEAVTAILGAPKASYYPNYVEQNLQEGPGALPRRVGGRPEFATYMDSHPKDASTTSAAGGPAPGSASASIKGWKRYRPSPQVRQAAAAQTAAGKEFDASRVQTHFRPLDKGTEFVGKLRVHNVTPEELGALLWALDFGDPDHKEGFLHQFGMARSLGYGAAEVRVNRCDLQRANSQPLTDLAEPRKSFADFMEEQLGTRPGGWANSPTITELRNLARPAADQSTLRYPTLQGERPGGEFVEIKVAGLALRSVTDWTAWGREHGNVHAALRSSGKAAARPSPSAPPAAFNAPAFRPKPAAAAEAPRVEVVLLGLSKSGKWKARLADGSGEGIFTAGEAPKDAVAGQTVKARLVRPQPARDQFYGW